MAKTKTEKLAEELMRFGRQAKQGITFGFADELQDLPAAAVASALSEDLTFKDALKMARELSRQELGQDWKESPILSFAGQAAGSVPLGLTKTAQSAANWIRGGSKLAGARKGALVGAGYGAASGLGGADDTLVDRLTGMGIGAGTGALLGAATSPLARMGKSPDNVDYKSVTEKTANGFDNKAQKELARQLAARPDLSEQLARAEGMAAASQKSGIPLTLAEMVAQTPSDPLLAQQAVIASNPMTAGRMAQMYAGRSGTPQQSGQIEQRLMQLARELDHTVGSYDEAAAAVIGQAGKASGNITRQLSGQAAPLYAQAYQTALPENAPILQNPLIQSALQKAKSNPVYAQEIGDLADNSIQALDAVKRSLDDMAESAGRAGNRNEARLINSAKTQLLSAMDEVSPEYGQARGIYSGNPDALQMRERIGALADIDPMEAKRVGQQLFSGTQQNADLAAQALGERAPTAAATRIYGAMDELRNDPVNIASRIAPDKRTSDMMRSYAGNQYAPIEETLGVINQAKLGERMRYGSPTQPRMQAEQGLAKAAADTALDVKTGGFTAVARKVASMFGKGTPDQDPQFYADMADLMLTEQGMDLLRRVASGQQTAIQELSNIGLPSIIANRAALNQSLPLGRAAIGGMVAPTATEQTVTQQSIPTKQDDFSDIEAILNQRQKPMQDFSDIERILQGR